MPRGIGFGSGIRFKRIAGGFTTLTQITDYTGTTNIGDMTGGGGLAALWDGTTDQSAAAGASLGGTPAAAYGGKLWTAAKTIGRFIIYDPNNEGHTSSGVDVNFRLYGKNSAPSAYNDGTLLFTSPAQTYTIPTATYDTTAVNSIDITAPYTYHWIAIVPAGTTGAVYMAEIIFYEWT